jgi:hypothetical protein
MLRPSGREYQHRSKYEYGRATSRTQPTSVPQATPAQTPSTAAATPDTASSPKHYGSSRPFMKQHLIPKVPSLRAGYCSETHRQWATCLSMRPDRQTPTSPASADLGKGPPTKSARCSFSGCDGGREREQRRKRTKLPNLDRRCCHARSWRGKKDRVYTRGRERR